jgi:hypothetical protein
MPPRAVIVEGQTARNPATGERIVYRQGRWYPAPTEDEQTQATADPTMSPLTPGSESRTRVALGFGPAVEAQRRMAAEEAASPRNTYGVGPLTWHGGGNPYNDNLMAVVADHAVPFDGGAAARAVGGPAYQNYEQSGRTFEAAFLPILSGAAVTPSEAQRQIRANLPQLGDRPEVLAQKARQRAMMINAAADLVGRPRPFPEIGTWDFQGGGAAQAHAPPPAAPAAAPHPTSRQPAGQTPAAVRQLEDQVAHVGANLPRGIPGGYRILSVEGQ